jgi:hypothetical protein
MSKELKRCMNPGVPLFHRLVRTVPHEISRSSSLNVAHASKLWLAASLPVMLPRMR